MRRLKWDSIDIHVEKDNNNNPNYEIRIFKFKNGRSYKEVLMTKERYPSRNSEDSQGLEQVNIQGQAQKEINFDLLYFTLPKEDVEINFNSTYAESRKENVNASPFTTGNLKVG
ncbi:hypothetical protein V6N13_025696 [Hibiscus sabdariffa]